jgi:heme/copper-type cytochrome/quinol oxidase subunit 2
MTSRKTRRTAAAIAGVVACVAVYATGGMRPVGAAPPRAAAQERETTVRVVKLSAQRYRFEPARIEVFADDLVRIELHTEDIAHSFTLDGYRIAKRAGPSQPVTFEFRADRTGTFPFYCSLQIDDGCRQMRGELVVKRR